MIISVIHTGKHFAEEAGHPARPRAEIVENQVAPLSDLIGTTYAG